MRRGREYPGAQTVSRARRRGVGIPCRVLCVTWLAAVAALRAAEPPPQALYVRAPTLAATLTATRGRYLAWQQSQAWSRSDLTWGPWSATGLLAADPADEALLPAATGGTDATTTAGTPLWSARPEWQEMQSVAPATPWLKVAPLQALVVWQAEHCPV